MQRMTVMVNVSNDANNNISVVFGRGSPFFMENIYQMGSAVVDWLACVALTCTVYPQHGQRLRGLQLSSELDHVEGAAGVRLAAETLQEDRPGAAHHVDQRVLRGRRHTQSLGCRGGGAKGGHSRLAA